jgi:undecaprenyl pyrophosphate synthase
MPEKSLRRIGLIPDGDRRWARLHHRSKAQAYERGAERFVQILDANCDEGNTDILAAWAISQKNIARSSGELRAVLDAVQKMLVGLRDHWLDQEGHQDVRLVHMGRADGMCAYPHGRKILRTLGEIREHTRNRAGLAVALCLDYDGVEEQGRAIGLWKAMNSPDADGLRCFADRVAKAGDDRYAEVVHDLVEQGVPPGMEWRAFLDLPRWGVQYRPFDLIIRTGIPQGDSIHDGAFLLAYRNETRLRAVETLFPDFTPEVLSAECARCECEGRRNGK